MPIRVALAGMACAAVAFGGIIAQAASGVNEHVTVAVPSTANPYGPLTIRFRPHGACPQGLLLHSRRASRLP